MIHTLFQVYFVVSQFVELCVHHAASAANTISVEAFPTGTHRLGVIGRSTEEAALQELEFTSNSSFLVAERRVLKKDM